MGFNCDLIYGPECVRKNMIFCIDDVAVRRPGGLRGVRVVDKSGYSTGK